MLSRIFKVAILCAAGYLGASAETASANYYASYVYYPSSNYYVSYYYYKPAPTYVGYHSHYCYYYPSYSTQYVYFYNPYRRVFWGRYDLKAKGYSMLAENDRKAELKDIPDAAFPAPSEMPAIPEAEGAGKMDAPPAPPQAPPKQ